MIKSLRGWMKRPEYGRQRTEDGRLKSEVMRGCAVRRRTEGVFPEVLKKDTFVRKEIH